MTGDLVVVEAARAALQRSEIAHRQAAEIPEAPAEWSADHAILADHAADHEQRLIHFDPARRLDTSGLDALMVGEDALRREAAGWRYLGEAAVGSWRVDFAASADEAEHAADTVQMLRQRLLQRDHAAELEKLWAQRQPEAER
jgi:hypothetical protein